MKACSTCPFLKATNNHGSPEWFVDVMKLVQVNKYNHTCHRTDPVADGYVKGEARQCAGILMIKENEISRGAMFPQAFRSFQEFARKYFRIYKIEGFLK